MSKDFNNVTYPTYEASDKDPAVPEAHLESSHEGLASNVKGATHPLFSSEGLIQTINQARNISNTSEPQLSGEIKEQFFVDVVAAARKTKCPVDLLLFMCDWEKDVTSRSDGKDAEGIAKKIVSNVSSLRQTLGRDPLHAEVFAAHVVKDAGKVKQIYDDNKNKPEKPCTPPGSDKDPIVTKKLRNAKEVLRTNREMYDFFHKRFPTGKVLYKQLLGKDKYTA